MGKDLRGKEIGEGLSQRKDGLYVARFTSRAGKREQKTSKKLDDVKIWLLDKKYEDRHGSIEAGGEMTVDVWYHYWIDYIKGDNIRLRTRESYNHSYNDSIKPYIGNIPLKDIKQLHCQNVINKEQERGLGESSAKHIIMIMNMFFQAAVENGLILNHPIKSRIQYRRDKKKERRVLSVAEQELFLKVAKNCVYYDMFCFALQTGMRFGELAGLQWDDIDYKNRTIHVQRSAYRKNSSEYFINPPKTMAGDRYIPITNTAMEILNRLRKKRREHIISFDLHKFIFLNKNDNIMKLDDCDTALRTIADRNNIERFSMHTLRHTFATRCIEAGMKPKILQKILGHSQISMTLDLYVHASPEELQKEMKLLEKMA